MTTDRKYDADMFPYLMSDVENVIFEKSDSLHERSGLLRSIEVKPRNYCGKSTVMIAMVTASSSSMDKKLKKGDIRFFIYLMLYVSYLILGSLAFRSMELETEIDLKNNFRDARERFQQKYSNVIDDDLEKFIKEVLKVNGHGLSPLRNASIIESNWSFGNSLFFSSTVITTIGYGNITPLTDKGKIFCILYAIVGIPLTLVLLTAAVKRLLVPCAWLLRRIDARLKHLFPLSIRLLHLVIIVISCGIMFLIIPSIALAHLEDWSKLDAFYFCFISLTTIGLGDFVPGEHLDQPYRSIYKIAVNVYLYLGLIAVMLNLAVFCDIPQLNLGQLFSESEKCEQCLLQTATEARPCVGELSKEEAHRSIVY